MHNTQDCRRHEKSGNEKSDFRVTKKGTKKPYPTKQSFTQLCKKMDKLEKVIKKRRNVAVATLIPTQNRELGQVA